jgi:L-lactate dehydrogenase complex protein LldG
MATLSSREKILNKIRKALSQSVPLPFPHAENSPVIFPSPSEDLSVVFATVFTGLQGKFSYCQFKGELVAQINQLLRDRGWKEVYCRENALIDFLTAYGFQSFTKGTLADCDVSITTCEALVARTGSMVLSAAQSGGRTTSVYAPVHICIATTSQLVYDIRDALAAIRDKYPDGLPSLVTFATGPSRTADIEKTLVVGVHGPREVYCFLLENMEG